MKSNALHDIANYLHHIISSTEQILKRDAQCQYAQKIKESAYRIDSLLTDSANKDLELKQTLSRQRSVDLKQFKGMKVLIVDDLTENIQIMENIFTTLSCIFYSAMNGQEAVKLYKNGYRPDVVCMDMVMPMMDGVATIKALKESGCDSYFIAVSALKNQPSDIVSQFDAWIPKPFTMQQIIQALLDYKTSIESAPASSKETPKFYVDAALREQIFSLSQNGAYSELKKLLDSLENTDMKEYLGGQLKALNFESISHSVISS